MAGRRVVRKSAASKTEEKHVPRSVATEDEKVSDTQIVWSANMDAQKYGIDNSKPAKILSKVISLQVSVGSYDRGRSIEDLIKEIKTKLGAVAFGNDGIHASVLGSYYVLDGKVCQPADYDPKKQNFRDGALPPSWAGGPLPSKTVKPRVAESSNSSAAISAQNYDKKYGPGGSPTARAKIAEQKEALRRRKEGPSDDELEDLDIDFDFLDDDDAVEEVAAKSQRAAVRKITKTKKTVVKRVIAKKKPESASKKPVRVVRRKK